MTANDPLEHLSDTARQRADVFARQPGSFFISAALAGAYIGLGVVLMLLVGATMPPEIRKLAMGASFGVALTLVVFAGADLFTGHNLYDTVALMRGRMKAPELCKIWIVCWLGNLAGAMVLSWFLHLANPTLLEGNVGALLRPILQDKAASLYTSLFVRAVLCNWIVCLAVWMCAKTDSDGAKCILIWWCVFTFIVCGFEHSVANMSFFTLALIHFDVSPVTEMQVLKSLLVVTLGNIVGGAGVVAFGYALQQPEKVDDEKVPLDPGPTALR